MKKFIFTLIGFLSISQAAVILEDYDIQAGADPIDGSSATYGTGGSFFTQYNGSNFDYTESDLTSNGWPSSDEQLTITTAATADPPPFSGVLRYNVASTQRTDAEPFIADLIANPVFQFDARLDAANTTSSFVLVNLNINTNAGGFAGNLASFGPSTSIQTFSHDVWNDSNFQDAWTEWKNGNGTFFQIRIVQQMENDSTQTSSVEYDNIVLVPEPGTLALVGIALISLIPVLRRKG